MKSRGRPNESQRVRSFRIEHPDGTKAQCRKMMGLDYKTISKWWNYDFKSDNNMIDTSDRLRQINSIISEAEISAKKSHEDRTSFFRLNILKQAKIFLLEDISGVLFDYALDYIWDDLCATDVLYPLKDEDFQKIADYLNSKVKDDEVFCIHDDLFRVNAFPIKNYLRITLTVDGLYEVSTHMPFFPDWENGYFFWGNLFERKSFIKSIDEYIELAKTTLEQLDVSDRYTKRYVFACCMFDTRHDFGWRGEKTHNPFDDFEGVRTYDPYFDFNIPFICDDEHREVSIRVFELYKWDNKEEGYYLNI